MVAGPGVVPPATVPARRPDGYGRASRPSGAG